jgi:hypothetical protein
MKHAIVLTVLASAAGMAQAQQADMAAARTALLAPNGYEVTTICGKNMFPSFGVKMIERDGKVFAKFGRCERELELVSPDEIKGEYCNSQPFQWSYQPGNSTRTFRGKGGRANCVTELSPR